MIDKDQVFAPGQHVSIPHEVMNQIMQILHELPARVSMEAITSVREYAAIVPMAGDGKVVVKQPAEK